MICRAERVKPPEDLNSIHNMQADSISVMTESIQAQKAVVTGCYY